MNITNQSEFMRNFTFLSLGKSNTSKIVTVTSIIIGASIVSMVHAPQTNALASSGEIINETLGADDESILAFATMDRQTPSFLARKSIEKNETVEAAAPTADRIKVIPVPDELSVGSSELLAIAETTTFKTPEKAPSSTGTVITSVSGNGYPWANAPFPNSIADDWGMYQRQCVSYAAWKVAASGRQMPFWGGRGNASSWDDNARADGIAVSSTPQVGSVAVSHAGGYGHVSYVEQVYGDGTIRISQYNAGWDGMYSEEKLSTSGLVFIHF